MLKEPIIPGKLCQIEIYRGYNDLGVHLVGGCDTALVKYIKLVSKKIVIIYYNDYLRLKTNRRIQLFNKLNTEVLQT